LLPPVSRPKIIKTGHGHTGYQPISTGTGMAPRVLIYLINQWSEVAGKKIFYIDKTNTLNNLAFKTIRKVLNIVAAYIEGQRLRHPLI
jgi:hypothetical protein